MARYTPPKAGTWVQEHEKFARVMEAWGVIDYRATTNVNKAIERIRTDRAVAVAS